MQESARPSRREAIKVVIERLTQNGRWPLNSFILNRFHADGDRISAAQAAGNTIAALASCVGTTTQRVSCELSAPR